MNAGEGIALRVDGRRYVGTVVRALTQTDPDTGEVVHFVAVELGSVAA